MLLYYVEFFKYEHEIASFHLRMIPIFDKALHSKEIAKWNIMQYNTVRIVYYI